MDNKNGSYPGGMPPHQQPYVPYQQSYQQQGYRHPQPHPGPPSPRNPQPGRIINAEGRPQQQALPTQTHGPYRSGGLPTEPSPGYQYNPGRNNLVAPSPSPRRDPYSPNSGSRVSPQPKSPADSHRHDDRSRSHTRSRSHSRPRHRSISSSQLKSILKNPSPQPSPQPPQLQLQSQAEPKPERRSKSRSKHHHHHRHDDRNHQSMPVSNPHNPLGPILVTEQDILSRGLAELAPLAAAVRDVVVYEFALPGSAPVDLSFSLSSIDLDPLPPSRHPVVSWSLGTAAAAGPLHSLTGSRILAPVLSISLPAHYPRPVVAAPSRTFGSAPAPTPDHGVIAACERVVASLRYGSAAPYPTSHLSLHNAYQARTATADDDTLHLPPPLAPGLLPFRVGGELFGSACVFRCGAADRNTVLGALAWVYLPCAGRPGLYERVEKDGREGRRVLRRWAREWGVEGELGEYFGRDG